MTHSLWLIIEAPDCPKPKKWPNFRSGGLWLLRLKNSDAVVRFLLSASSQKLAKKCGLLKKKWPKLQVVVSEINFQYILSKNLRPLLKNATLWSQEREPPVLKRIEEFII